MTQQFKYAVEKAGGPASVKAYLQIQYAAIVDATALSLLQEFHPPHGPKEEEIISRLAKSSKYRELLMKAISIESYEELEEHVSTTVASMAEPHGRDETQSVEEYSLAKAFVSAYEPGAESALYDFLTRCNTQYGTKNHYGKFCSIVQSSGTGKSRTLIELRRKDVVVLYMNVRGLKEQNAYPPRDEVPSKILTSRIDDSAEDYTDRCIAFFTALFKTLHVSLKQLSESCGTREQIIAAWSSGMCTLDSQERTRFFSNVKQAYDDAMTGIRKKHDLIEEHFAKMKLQDNVPTDQKYTAPKLATPSTSGSSNKEASTNTEANETSHAGGGSTDTKPGEKKEVPQLPGEVTMAKAYHALLYLEPPVLLRGTDEPQLAIVIDEAHMLRQPHQEYLPSHILCRIISAFSKTEPTSVWVVFASTASRVADFSAPAYIHPSLRISQGGSLLFRPYSVLDWDQRAHPPGSIGPQDTARFENIVRLGRPLWQSLVESGLSPNTILDTAGQKICNNQAYNRENSEQALALLGQRFILEVCFGRYKSNQFVENAVSSHMRVCIGTTEDRAWQKTSYPSEPLLSCAVAQLLHTPRSPVSGSADDVMQTELSHLKTAVVDKLVDKGQKGELISRLIYLLGKDLLVRKNGFAPVHRMESELHDCRAISVISYLGFIFGPGALNSDIKTLLNGWHINFSHWIGMEKAILRKGSKDMETWLMRHWTRTSAVQCCHNQHSFDKVIPMYNPHINNFSFILISDKAKGQTSEIELPTISPQSGKLPSINQPYIAILADLGVKARKAKVSIDNSTEPNAVRIYAPGIGSEPYLFLEQHTIVAASLQAIVGLPDISDEKQTDNEKRVANRMQFGITCEDKHMDWKHSISPSL